ncbi:MAG: hybrid sensor histidine kinase/response regulator [Desulfobacterales bacterium]|jgi:signal transduction histidine kinase
MEDKLLLVDDEEGIRKVLDITLTDLGYRVYTAADGKEALQLFRENNPPIVLTDIKMPGIDGVELLRRIKHENPDTEVIMITGHGDMDLAIQSLKNEATDFITKPINDDILEISVRKARERILIREKLRDYTASLEALLREKSTLQDRLSSLGLRISSISHGIKGLLTGLDGGIYLVDGGFRKENPEQVKEGWSIVKEMVERIRKMVLDILFYARERKLSIEPVDVRRFCEEVAQSVETKLADCGIEFETDFAGADGKFAADKGYLRTALINILENAADACREKGPAEGGRVTFRAAGEDGTLLFEIADTGIGMDGETREKIFNLFFSSKGNRGTGLGLYISRMVVEQHGGTIRVRSHPGRGSRFIVKVPRSGPDTEDRATDPARNESAAAT